MRKAIVLALLALVAWGCDYKPTSDEVQRDQQEKILAEATSAVGMPAIRNFREKRLLKMVLEMRDQEGLVTYTYMENLQPAVVHGKTALGGKLTFLAQSIGYGIPYATEFTSPQKLERYSSYGPVVLPQADPNGLFAPSSAEGTWIMVLGTDGKTQPIYVEPRVVVSPFRLPPD